MKMTDKKYVEKSVVSDLIWTKGTYGGYLDVIAGEMMKIISAGDLSPVSLKRLAFILMVPSSDFITSNQFDDTPFVKARRFLGRQSEEVKSVFRLEAMNLPDGERRSGRINWLLSSPNNQPGVL